MLSGGPEILLPQARAIFIIDRNSGDSPESQRVREGIGSPQCSCDPKGHHRAVALLASTAVEGARPLPANAKGIHHDLFVDDLEYLFNSADFSAIMNELQFLSAPQGIEHGVRPVGE